MTLVFAVSNAEGQTVKVYSYGADSVPKSQPEIIRDVKKNYIGTTLSYLLLNSEPNINFERFLSKRASLYAYAGYKFPNIFGRNGAPVWMKYEGFRSSLALRIHEQTGLFVGIVVGYSALSISDITVYESASSYAEYYSGFSSTRMDVDAALTIGWHANLVNDARFEVFLNYGVRNASGSTTYKYHHPGNGPIGGAILFYNNPILNGHVAVQFFQVGLSYGFQF